MDQDFQTSFIPKKPIVETRAKASRPVGLLSITAFFILFTVLIVTGGIYIYKGIITKDIEKMKTDLNTSRQRFEESKINQLQTLDRRLIASNEVLNKHISISPIFKALQDITMKSVRYTKFDYIIDSEKGTVTIRMHGQATGYKSIALQSDLFTKNSNRFIDPVFSNLTLDDKGNVDFNLEFRVDPAFVNYKKSLMADNTTSVIEESIDNTSEVSIPVEEPINPPVMPSTPN